jgi:hypothetical protein
LAVTPLRASGDPRHERFRLRRYEVVDPKGREVGSAGKRRTFFC